MVDGVSRKLECVENVKIGVAQFLGNSSSKSDVTHQFLCTVVSSAVFYRNTEPYSIMMQLEDDAGRSARAKVTG
jgi:hypothetical protein